MTALSKKTLKISKASALHFFLSITLLIDFMNGMLSSLHIGEICRVLIIILCFSILIDRQNKAPASIAIYLFLFLNVVFSLIIFHNTEGFVYDISMALKVSLSYLLCASIIKLHKKGLINGSYIESIVEANLLYGPGLFIVSRIIGRGDSSYLWNNTNLGFKSEFMSLNSVNVALIVLYIYTISKLFSEKQHIRWSLLSLYVIIPLAMLGTKTSIAIIVIVPILMFLINTRSKKVWITAGTLLLLLVIFYPYISKIVSSSLNAVIERQKFYFQRRDFITYLFSTRNQRLIRSLTYYFQSFSILDIFPGRGYYEFHRHIIYTEIANVIPIEMDWADILTAYGPIGFLFTYVYSVRQLRYAKNHLREKHVQLFFWSSIIIIIFGTLAGHVYLEAISSTFLAIITSGVVIYAKDDNQLLSTKEQYNESL